MTNQSTTSHRCPVDGAPLVAISHGESCYHACEQCQGLWLSRMFLLALRRKTATQLRNQRHASADLAPPIAHGRDLTCPGCNDKMNAQHLDGIPVDICTSCKALWLDADELLHLAKATKIQETTADLEREKDRDWKNAILNQRDRRHSTLRSVGTLLSETEALQFLADRMETD